MSSETTVTATTAGAAFGGLVGWAVSALTGADTVAITGTLATLGSFTFGLIFPR